MLKKVFVFSLFFISSNTFSASNNSFNEQAFKQYAQKYGNKTANLHELESVVKEINSDNKIETTFVVPTFFGVNHREVVDYLKSVKNGDGNKAAYDVISAKWQEFTKAQPKDKTTITSGAKKVLADIRAVVHRAFEGSFDIGDKRRDEFNSFIKNAQEKLLMVRSTGREDSKELSNAGGNESVSSVSSDINAISKAMGEVIASYFGEKSIGQRLALKDKDIYSAPFMSVLVQVMIGEPAGGNDKVIPASGVVFQPEAEGKTPGVSAIQATWGHNEAVVNGLVSVDTFYVGIADIIHPVVRVKRDRLITVGTAASKLSSSSSSSSLSSSSNGVQTVQQASQSGLVLMRNPKYIHQIPCLTKENVLDLHHAAGIIKKHYNYAVDIEFVIQNNNIYLVQVRPLEDQKINPSYIKPQALDNITKQNIVHGAAIGVGGASVRMINNKQKVLVEDNIRVALSTFLSRDDKDAIQAVIVGQMAPSTSHEATIFRANNKPVIFVNDLALIKKWISGDTPLLIDPQQELIVPLDLFKSNKVIQEGWYSHPISKRVSIFNEFLKKDFTKEILETVSPKEFFKGTKTSELITILKTEPKDEAIRAVRSILRRVYEAITRAAAQLEVSEKAKIQANTKMALQLKGVFAHLLMCAAEFYQVINRTDDQLERLYPLTFIEALIRQIPKQGIVNSYSLASVLKTEQQEQELIKEAGLEGQKLRPFIVQYAKAKQYALNDEVAQKWNLYLKSLAKLNSSKDKLMQRTFAHMIKTISNLELMPMWINVSFADVQKKFINEPQKITKNLIDEYTQSIGFIKQLEKMKLAIDSINVQNWEKPELFKKLVTSFSHNILNYFESREFIGAYNKAGTIGKLAAITVMRDLVEIFDTSIKALKASKNVGNFAQVLSHYKNLLDAWGDLPSSEYETIKKKEKEYFAFVNQLWNEVRGKKNIEQLVPSENLSVQAATIGSAALLGRAKTGKVSLEDVFSLIHQDLLMVLNALTKKNTKYLSKPEKIKALEATLKKHIQYYKYSASSDSHDINYEVSLIGIELDQKHLILFYNIPLRNHSSAMQVDYDLATGKMILSVQLMGQGESRWEFLRSIILAFSAMLDLPIAQKPELVGSGTALTLSFAWEVTNKNKEQAAKLINLCMRASFIEDITFEGIVKKVIEIVKQKGLKEDSIRETLFSLTPHMPDPNAKIFYSIMKKSDILPRLATLQKVVELTSNTGGANYFDLVGLILSELKFAKKNDQTIFENIKTVINENKVNDKILWRLLSKLTLLNLASDSQKQLIILIEKFKNLPLVYTNYGQDYYAELLVDLYKKGYIKADKIKAVISDGLLKKDNEGRLPTRVVIPLYALLMNGEQIDFVFDVYQKNQKSFDKRAGGSENLRKSLLLNADTKEKMGMLVTGDIKPIYSDIEEMDADKLFQFLTLFIEMASKTVSNENINRIQEDIAEGLYEALQKDELKKDERFVPLVQKVAAWNDDYKSMFKSYINSHAISNFSSPSSSPSSDK